MQCLQKYTSTRNANDKQEQELTVTACCLLIPLLMAEKDPTIDVINKEPIVPTPTLVIKGNPYTTVDLAVIIDGTVLHTTSIYHWAFPQLLQRFTSLATIDREEFNFVTGPTGVPIQLGKGSFATVYLARWSKVQVAVKMFSLDIANYDDNVLSSLRHEAALMRNLQHPNIGRLFGVCIDEVNDEGYIVMSYIDGVDLHTALFRKSSEIKIPDTLPAKGKIACQLSAAVGHMHFKNVIHQDIKPSNIMIAKRPQFETYLCDLGAAKIKACSVNSTLTQTGRNPVTPIKYVAPECELQGLSPGKSSDIWSMGCTLAELFSGAPLWDLKGVPTQQQEASIKKRRADGACPEAVLGIDIIKFKKVKDIIAQMLDYNYKSRPCADDVCDFFLDQNVFA